MAICAAKRPIGMIVIIRHHRSLRHAARVSAVEGRHGHGMIGVLVMSEAG